MPAAKQSTTAHPPKKKWVKTPVANLVRYTPSGVYFTRVRVSGKLFRESLDTGVFSVAKLRLADFVKDKRSDMGVEEKVKTGKMTFGEALQVFRDRLDYDPDLKEGAKVYRRKCITALLKSWPELEETNVAKISKNFSPRQQNLWVDSGSGSRPNV